MTTRIPVLCLVAIVLASVLPGVAIPGGPGLQSALPLDDIDFLIVTTEEMAPQFQRLADARQAGGLTSRVVTIPWIQSVTPAGADLQDTIREFLRAAYLDWGIEYLLLGGDHPELPARFARTNFWPTRPDVASDLYFACLNGDWDGDGDGLYAEYGEDDVDLVPELKVGRAPVRNAAEAAVFVDKTLSYAAWPNRDRMGDALLLAEVLEPRLWSPGDWITLDGAEQAEVLVALLAGSGSPFRICRLYRNSGGYTGAFPLNRQSALDSLGSGRYGLVSFIGHANGENWSVGYPEVLTLADVSGLANDDAPFFIEALACDATGFPDTTMLEVMLRNPTGGCAAAVGPSGLTFIVPARELQRAFFTTATAASPGPVGDIMAAALETIRDQAGRDSSYYQAFLSYVLLGDPTLRFGPAATTQAPSTPPRVHVSIRSYPNPFNPRTTIRFEIPVGGRVQLAVYDVAGRLIRSLVDADMPQGSHEAVWNGKNEAGQAVASGSYFARLLAGGKQQTTRMSLVR